MEWNAETLKILSECFLHTLSPNHEPRRQAESYLSEASDKPNFGLAVLRLVAETNIDDQIRISAAVNFKNHLKSRWISVETNKNHRGNNNPDAPVLSPIDDTEKEQIKQLILPLMLSASPRIQSQLSEALVVIGKHDFPKAWPALLPQIVSSLRQGMENNDYVTVNGILGTANSIFKKFRYQYKTNDLLLDLKYCLDGFAAPLLDVFMRTANVIDSMVGGGGGGGGTAANLKPLMESQRLCCRIFFSLNFMEIPEFFEDHMKEWMGEFKKYLTSTYPALEGGGGDGLALVDDLRAAVCENISLYLERYEEEFAGYLKDFALAVWTLLVGVSSATGRDRLTITAIKFLTTISTSVHHNLFAGADVLQQICQSIVIPNARLREEDEELFEFNYVEFVRRDIEGSDVDTRRRIACELLKGIATNYKTEVQSIVVEQIKNMLAVFNANPAENWRDKDCAIYLVVSLATRKAGGTSASTDLVDVGEFFGSVIIPEIQSQSGSAMLKAGALKFFTVFRNEIPKQTVVGLMGDVVRFLASESNVVHSYAANCVEKLLLIKDGGQRRFNSTDINPFLPILMTNLFNALKFPESEENSYVMKCIMRVLGVADFSQEVAGHCITGLTHLLSEVCKNPKNPVYNHYLFEAVAGLVGRVCEKDPSLIPTFEASIFPILQYILGQNVTEFWPYAFQLLAQLVNLNKPPLPASYMSIFELLLATETWKGHANTPALVQLLQAYLKKAPDELSQGGRLGQVLGIFQKLVDVPSTEELGFYVLNTIIENLRYDVIAPFVTHIWTALFTKLMQSPKVKFIKCMVIYMSLFLVKYGPPALTDSINAIQNDGKLLGSIIEQFWIPHLKSIIGTIELKLTAVASTRLICESTVLLDPAAAATWGKMLNSIVTLLSRPEEERVDEDPEVPEIGENVGYSASFVRLHNAGKKDEDPVSDIRDPKEFLVRSLARLSAMSPGRYPTIIQQSLDPANQTALLQLCSTYNCTIV